MEGSLKGFWPCAGRLTSVPVVRALGFRMQGLRALGFRIRGFGIYVGLGYMALHPVLLRRNEPRPQKPHHPQNRSVRLRSQPYSKYLGVQRTVFEVGRRSLQSILPPNPKFNFNKTLLATGLQTNLKPNNCGTLYSLIVQVSGTQTCHLNLIFSTDWLAVATN